MGRIQYWKTTKYREAGEYIFRTSKNKINIFVGTKPQLAAILSFVFLVFWIPLLLSLSLSLCLYSGPLGCFGYLFCFSLIVWFTLVQSIDLLKFFCFFFIHSFINEFAWIDRSIDYYEIWMMMMMIKNNDVQNAKKKKKIKKPEASQNLPLPLLIITPKENHPSIFFATKKKMMRRRYKRKRKRSETEKPFIYRMSSKIHTSFWNIFSYRILVWFSFSVKNSSNQRRHYCYHC